MQLSANRETTGIFQKKAEPKAKWCRWCSLSAPSPPLFLHLSSFPGALPPLTSPRIYAGSSSLLPFPPSLLPSIPPSLTAEPTRSVPGKGDVRAAFINQWDESMSVKLTRGLVLGAEEELCVQLKDVESSISKRRGLG